MELVPIDTTGMSTKAARKLKRRFIYPQLGDTLVYTPHGWVVTQIEESEAEVLGEECKWNRKGGYDAYGEAV